MGNRWSKKVTESSNALDLEPGVFSLDDPRLFAESLKRSAELSERRKGTPYQSARSMLNFYINRAGKSLSVERRETLEQAKIELWKFINRIDQGMNQTLSFYCEFAKDETALCSWS